MKIFQVMFPGRAEFVGKTSDDITSEVIHLKDACKVTYSMQGHQLMRHITNIGKDPDYYNGDLAIRMGPGVVVFHLKEDGPYANQYRQNISGIVTPILKTPNDIKREVKFN